MINHLDPTGLEFIKPATSQYASRTFSVSGFRDKTHAENWKAAYHKQAMGYSPIIRIEEADGNFTINVNQSTSCD